VCDCAHLSLSFKPDLGLGWLDRRGVPRPVGCREPRPSPPQPGALRWGWSQPGRKRGRTGEGDGQGAEGESRRRTEGETASAVPLRRRRRHFLPSTQSIRARVWRIGRERRASSDRASQCWEFLPSWAATLLGLWSIFATCNMSRMLYHYTCIHILCLLEKSWVFHEIQGHTPGAAHALASRSPHQALLPPHRPVILVLSAQPPSASCHLVTPTAAQRGFSPGLKGPLVPGCEPGLRFQD
jgi:hypothetical protein